MEVLSNFSTADAFSNESSLQPLISAATAHAIETTVQVGVLPVVVVTGATLNVINMAVFVRQGLTDRINLCLFSLSMSDTGYILFLLASRMYSVFQLLDPGLAEYWKVKSLSVVGVYAGFLNTSNILTMIISLERCLCVLSPLRARRLLSRRYMAAIILLVYTVCLSGCGLVIFMYDTVRYRDPLTNTSHYRPVPSKYYLRNQVALDVIFEYVFNVTVPTASLVVVMLATVAIAVRLRSTLAWRTRTAHVGGTQLTSSTEQRETSVTRMLVVVCTIYTVCTTPYVVQTFTRIFVEEFDPGKKFNNVFYASISIIHLLASVNSSVNFFVYYTMSTRYRNTLKGMRGVQEKQTVAESAS